MNLKLHQGQNYSNCHLPKTSDSSDGCSSISFPKLQKLVLESCALFELNLFRTFDCGSTLNRLDLSRSDIVTIPPCIRRFVGLETLNLSECEKLREILGLPPNVKYVDAWGCISLTILLEETRRSQLFNTWDTQEHVGVGTVFPDTTVIESWK
jgi:Leucine-rich repeat (LRR) protein